MEKYKVLRNFNDLKTNQMLKTDDIVEITKERYAEMSENATVYGGIDTFLEKVVTRSKKKSNDE